MYTKTTVSPFALTNKDNDTKQKLKNRAERRGGKSIGEMSLLFLAVPVCWMYNDWCGIYLGQWCFTFPQCPTEETSATTLFEFKELRNLFKVKKIFALNHSAKQRSSLSLEEWNEQWHRNVKHLLSGYWQFNKLTEATAEHVKRLNRRKGLLGRAKAVEQLVFMLLQPMIQKVKKTISAQI